MNNSSFTSLLLRYLILFKPHTVKLLTVWCSYQVCVSVCVSVCVIVCVRVFGWFARTRPIQHIELKCSAIHKDVDSNYFHI